MSRRRAVTVACGLLAWSLAPVEGAIPSARVGQRLALIVSTGGAARGSAEALQRLLVESYGFGSNAVFLLNDDATGERILEAMNRLQGSLKDLDAVFVYLSLEQRPDPSGRASFSFLPHGASPGEPWTWLPALRVFEWLSAMPIGSGLIIYPSCPDKLEEYLIGELGYRKTPGSLELMRVCERASSNQLATEARSTEEWRAQLMGKVVGLLREAAAGSAPLPAPELASRLQNAMSGVRVDVRRVPEYIRQGFVFEPAARRVAGEQARYASATRHEEREAALRNIPGIVKAAADAARESQLAARFLADVALDPAAGVRGELDPSARLNLRSVAVEALGELRDDTARDTLVAILQKAADAPFIRRAALTQLSRLTPARPADLTAIQAAFADPEATVREAAVRTAVILNDTGAVGPLQGRLGNETQPAVRIAIIQALAALGTQDRAALVALLADPDVAIRREAVTALGRLGPDAGATSALVDRLRTDESADVRRQAAYALGRIQPETPAAPPPPEVTSALLDALNAGPGPVREAVAFALGRTGGPSAEGALRALLREGKTEAESVAAADALGRLKSEAALDDLAAALQNAERPGLRRAAAAALGEIGKPAAAAPLAAALEDRDPFVQRQAQQSLERISLSREGLERGLKHRSPRVRLTALRQAGKSNDPALVPALIAALADSDADVRQAAFDTLSAFRDPASLDHLARAARSESAVPSENRLTQFGALSVLATIPDLKAVQVVLALAQEAKDPTLRVEALAALGRQVAWLRERVTATADPAAEKTLDAAGKVALAAAGNESPAVRKAATPVLAAIPNGRARLEELAKSDPSREVQAAAIEQLRRATIQQRK